MKTKNEIKPFIIGAGVGRTGTLSLKLALDKLGFGPCYHGFLVAELDHSDFWYVVPQLPG